MPTMPEYWVDGVVGGKERQYFKVTSQDADIDGYPLTCSSVVSEVPEPVRCFILVFQFFLCVL